MEEVETAAEATDAVAMEVEEREAAVRAAAVRAAAVRAVVEKEAAGGSDGGALAGSSGKRHRDYWTLLPKIDQSLKARAVD
eukprot:scaffold317370_cov18-Tisochrysis_lutea.AAC.1